ncbi:alpha/beta-type small acid-soluble spore protein [Bacillus horti]|uniref:Alpha/beta-type small acid-soluble spore protein n=1 Tax=Caldalkalibacillus horti TaxID=77523 RepID=A0ABT9W5I0_9BACI|nr:alpha/beta-type small acid-soluble spore protein [Bacillus horti]MDQ0168332.1 hypothetical protein [Bacillus horti]
MARKRLLVPEAEEGMQQLKKKVMAEAGYSVDPKQPDHVKYEVAKDLNIPLHEKNNGQLRSQDAGKIGGQIGGRMVKELIRSAQEHLSKTKH